MLDNIFNVRVQQVLYISISAFNSDEGFLTLGYLLSSSLLYFDRKGLVSGV